MAKAPAPETRARPVPAQKPVPEKWSGPALAPLEVLYYARMHRQRVYAVAVSWDEDEWHRPATAIAPVLVRLVLAGAQVVPSEQPLDPARRDSRVTFYVTPLASGWLRGEHLEVLVGGRKVQEMPLRSKVTSQKLTWFLLALAFLVPWFLLSYGKYAVLTPNSYEEKILQSQAVQGKMKRPEMAQAKTPGGILDKRIAENLPDLPDAVDETAPSVREYLVKARGFVPDVYQGLINVSRDVPLAFYTGVSLLVLTLVSWWLHREKRNRRYGVPVPLPGGETSLPVTAAEPAE